MSDITFTNLSADSAEVLIYGEIGVNRMTGTGVDAKDFTQSLAGLGNVSTITVRINSPGGNFFAGTALYNALVRHPAHIAVKIDGVAGSAASFVAMAGDDIEIAENAKMMIHRSQVGCEGNCFEMREVADVLESLDQSIAGIYAQRTGRRTDTFLNMMNKDKWFTAQQALAERLVDRITPNKGVPTPARAAAPSSFSANYIADMAALAKEIVPRAPAAEVMKVTDSIPAGDEVVIHAPGGGAPPVPATPAAEELLADVQAKAVPQVDVASKLAEYNARIAAIAEAAQ